jgi:hypothetical protein
MDTTLAYNLGKEVSELLQRIEELEKAVATLYRERQSNSKENHPHE